MFGWAHSSAHMSLGSFGPRRCPITLRRAHVGGRGTASWLGDEGEFDSERAMDDVGGERNDLKWSWSGPLVNGSSSGVEALPVAVPIRFWCPSLPILLGLKLNCTCNVTLNPQVMYFLTHRIVDDAGLVPVPGSGPIISCQWLTLQALCIPTPRLNRPWTDVAGKRVHVFCRRGQTPHN